MKIIVCIKQICQTYAQTGVDAETHYLAPEDQIFRINPYDEAALEIALTLKDKHPDIEIILLILGPVIVEDELKRCLALGADYLYQIEQSASLGSQDKAKFLARALETLAPDLVLCGKESMDRQNGQVACFLAEFLNQPFVSAIETLNMSNDNKTAVVQRSCGRGARQILQSCLPAVFSVDMGAYGFRMPTLKAQARADIQPVHHVTGLSDASTGKSMVTSYISPPCPRTKRTLAPDSDLASFDRIKLLLTGSRMKKKTQILDGSPEFQVTGMISFLKEHGFLTPAQTQKSK
ncbi:electron transfer flavoprotein subunit beta/FixA family protein [Desulfobacula sp.]|uniref:electron transfer flavoprotein subunit beta/FixA family protein n=1 Tax=Desulfobacula sp. TaxID=2593537 RepID=UPI002609D666|nr:electron transfer flavoprotein subunit beta/FixA family protein [Desulfobacula sp.]